MLQKITSWAGAILALPFVIALLTWGVERLAAKNPPTSLFLLTSDQLTPWLSGALAWEALACGLLLVSLVLHQIPRARRRIVIREFRRYKGHQEVTQEGASGIAALLSNEILRMEELYRTVDAVSASQTGTIVRASPSVLSPDRVTEDLGETFGPAVTIPIGKFQIPVVSLLAVMGWLVRGPRLTGSVYEDPEASSAQRYVLVAHLSGGGLSGDWRVEGGDLTAESEPALVHRLVRILACRIVTDLTNLGSRRWQAIYHYTSGLRKMRLAQNRSQERIAALREAESQFRQALDEDAHLAQANFNLGLVYRDLGQGPAARLAFRYALKEDPDHHKACYALAESYHADGSYADALWLAQHAYEIQPRHPGAWNLWSQVRWRRDSAELNHPSTPPTGEILRGFEIAACTSWQELARAQRLGYNVQEAQDIARICSLHLGIAYSRKGLETTSRLLHWASRLTFRAALRLAPNDNDLNFALGEACWLAKDYKHSYEAFDRVFEDGLGLAQQTDLWAYLLSVHLHLAQADSSTRQKHDKEADDCYLLARDTLAIPDWAFPKDPSEPPRETYSDRSRGDFGTTARHDTDRQSDEEPLLRIVNSLETMDDQPPMERYGDRLHRFKETLERIGQKDPTATERLYLDRLERDRQFLLALEERSSERLKKGLETSDPSAENPLKTADPELPEVDPKWGYEQLVTRLADRFLGTERQADLPYEFRSKLIFAIERCLVLVKGRRFSSPFESRLREHLASACLLLSRDWKGHERKGKALNAALNMAEQATGRNPQSREGLLLLAKLHLEMGDAEQAREDLERCLHLPPDFPEAIHALGRALWQRIEGCDKAEHRREHLEKAQAQFKNLLQLAESDPLIGHTTHSLAHGWFGRFKCGLEDYDDGLYHLGIALEMGSPPIEFLLAAAEGHLGRAEEDAANLRQADLAAAGHLLKRIPETHPVDEYREQWKSLKARLDGAEAQALAPDSNPVVLALEWA